MRAVNLLPGDAGRTNRQASPVALVAAGGAALVAAALGFALVLSNAALSAGEADLARARAELAALTVALEDYRRDFGDYPRTDDPAVLRTSLLGRLDPAGRTIPALSAGQLAGFATGPVPGGSAVALLDPWQQPYRYAYRTPAAGWDHSRFILFSGGPDGRSASGLLAGGYYNPAPSENADDIVAGR